MSVLDDHLRRWEGYSLTAYQDSGGVWTVGFGHTGPEVVESYTITKAEAERLLAQDMAWVEAAIRDTVKVSLDEYQHAAIASLIYNIGGTAWRKSTCLRRLNVGDQAGAAEALTWFNKVNGEVVGGLVARREAERTLFLTNVHADAVTEARGEITGGETKPAVKSKTHWLAGIGLTGVLADILGAFTSIKSSAPEVLQVVGPVALLGLIFVFIMVNRYLEARRGEH